MSEIRARWPQRIIDWLETQPGDLMARVREEMKGADLEALERPSPLDWVGIDHHLGLLRSMRSQVGPESFEPRFREAAGHALSMPLFSPLIGPMVRLVGRKAMVLTFPRGWRMTCRNVGEPEVHQTSEDLEGTNITFHDVPVRLAQDDAYCASIGSMLAAVMDMAGVVGHVETDLTDRAQGRLRFRQCSQTPLLAPGEKALAERERSLGDSGK